jgi:hypothetical protein
MTKYLHTISPLTFLRSLLFCRSTTVLIMLSLAFQRDGHRRRNAHINHSNIHPSNTHLKSIIDPAFSLSPALQWFSKLPVAYVDNMVKNNGVHNFSDIEVSKQDEKSLSLGLKICSDTERAHSR